MNFYQRHRQILAIVLLASFFIFFKINHVDIIGDDGHYSFRAIGLVDFMLSGAQSTPVQWYEHMPWWAYLSFHDHPLGLFIVQHIFFIFGDSAFLAKLPYALFSLGTIGLTYLWVKQYYTEKIALLAALLLTLSADFIAVSRRPLMEAGVMFFLCLAIYSFVVFLQNSKNWWKLGITLGLLLEIKLTTLFIFPAFLSYLLITPIHRKNKESWKKLGLALLVTTLIALPTILYNGFMYKEQGHFSYQFARLLHQNSPWEAGGIETNLSASTINLTKNVGKWFSIPFLILIILGIFKQSFYWNKDSAVTSLPFLLLIWLIIEDLLTGAKNLYPILFSVIGAWALISFSEKTIKPQSKKIVTVIISFFVIYLGLYTINTNHLQKSFGPLGWLRGSKDPQNYGISQLDQYLDELLKKAVKNQEVDQMDAFPEAKAVAPYFGKYSLPDRTMHNTTIKNIIVYDNNLNWFPQTWVYARRVFYKNILMIPTKTLPQLVDTLGYTPHISYFIVSSQNTYRESSAYTNDTGETIEKFLLENGVKPEKIIYRDDGLEAFRIYHLQKSLRLRLK